jgi:hypothetical protein
MFPDHDELGLEKLLLAAGGDVQSAAERILAQPDAELMPSGEFEARRAPSPVAMERDDARGAKRSRPDSSCPPLPTVQSRANVDRLPWSSHLQSTSRLQFLSNLPSSLRFIRCFARRRAVPFQSRAIMDRSR